MTLKLFAVYLGGRAPRASIELHDMIFAAGTRIEDCYGQVLDSWFGTPGQVHIDSFLELDIVDGWKIALSKTPSPRAEKLFFINMGAYNSTDFTELHAISFHVATDALAAKKQALAVHFKSGETERHKDDLLDVDDCLAVNGVNELFVTLTRTNAVSTQKPSNAYHNIPKTIVAAWMARKKL